jgi:L-lactate dehydrogenase complex protein LldG
VTSADTRHLEELRGRATAAASIVIEVPDWSAVATLALEIANGEPIAVAPSLASAQPELREILGDRLLLPDPADPFASVADVAVGIVEGALAVAESGSVLLSQHDLADRAVGALVRSCIHAVERDRIVASLDEAAVWLEEHADVASLATLVTGPSRTADIERSLTIGVQGPSEVRLVLVG